MVFERMEAELCDCSVPYRVCVQEAGHWKVVMNGDRLEMRLHYVTLPGTPYMAKKTATYLKVISYYLLPLKATQHCFIVTHPCWNIVIDINIYILQVRGFKHFFLHLNPCCDSNVM